MSDDAEDAAFWTDVDAAADEAEVADEAEAWQFVAFHCSDGEAAGTGPHERYP